MAYTCAGCRKDIKNRYFLTCSKCNDKYDIECANVPEKRFINTMTKEHKDAWKCPLCRSKMSKKDNTGTPVRQYQDDEILTPSKKNINATKRELRHQAISPVLDDSECLYLGNTLTSESPSTRENTQSSPNIVSISLCQLNTLIKQNLEENNKIMISQIGQTIKTEIEDVLQNFTQELKQTKEEMQIKFTTLENNISLLDVKIHTLENECAKLQEDNIMLHKKLNEIQSNPHASQNSTIDNEKIVVLHGLTTTYWETENELLDRVAYIFNDILNIDIPQYIEEITFIGGKGLKRPLKIELNSKRLKKYILQNSIYFKNSGLSVSEYLNESLLRERRELKKAMLNARKKGQRAYIKNNKLIINGKEYTEHCLKEISEELGNSNQKLNSKSAKHESENLLNSTINDPSTSTTSPPFRN